MSAAGKRIVFIATDLSTGGGVNRVMRDLSALFAKDLGADVTVVAARSDAPPTYEFDRSVSVEMRGPGGVLHYVREIWRVRRSSPDVVIGSWTQDNVLLLALFLCSRTRAVVIEHQSWFVPPLWVRTLRRLFYPLAWHVLVLNRAELRHYSSQLRNVELLPNPVSGPAGNEKKRDKLIIAVGHLDSRKDFAQAIQAMAESRLEAEGWALAIIGRGPEHNRLQQLIRELGLVRSSIVDPVSDIGQWYARASMILVTSKTEVFSLVLAEAMQSGVVPVAFAADGPSFLLEDFADHLVEAGDVAGMAERMRRFAGVSDQDALRAALRQSILSRFSLEVVAARWREVLA